MRILFVPFAEGGIGHIIPLLALNLKLKGTQHKSALLLPGKYHRIAKNMGFDVLDIDHSQSDGGFLKELSAFGKFNPDIVVDDTSLTTLFSTRLSKKPRVAIQRTGTFPGGRPRRINKKYGLEKIILMDEYKVLGNTLRLPEFKNYTDLFAAEIKIVPGIKTIEVLPDHLRSDPSYIFCGPLIIDDFYLGVDSGAIEEVGSGKSYDLAPLESFFNANKNRFKVFCTYGTQNLPTRSSFNIIKYLLDNNIAVVTSTDTDELNGSQHDLCFFAAYLPMNYVCANVDLMIHHCGSGTYQYQILHQLPSITIDTELQDRIDIALRLEELGVNCHLPSPDACEDFFVLFKKALDKYIEPSGSFYFTVKKNLLELKEETDRVSSAFDLDAIFNQALERFSVSKGCLSMR